MQPFTTYQSDPLFVAAQSVIDTVLNEGVDEIKAKVAKMKVGEVTNFGTITKIGDSFIEFKANLSGKTSIKFNQRKMGSKDFVLDKLISLKKEDVDGVLDEATGSADIDTSFDSASEKAKWVSNAKAKGLTVKFSGQSTLVSGDKKALAKFLVNHYDSKGDAMKAHPGVFKEGVDYDPLEEEGESDDLAEAYVTKYPETKKAWKKLNTDTDLDADEWEDFLFTMANYYTTTGHDSDDEDFIKLGKNLEKAAKDWKNRKGN